MSIRLIWFCGSSLRVFRAWWRRWKRYLRGPWVLLLGDKWGERSQVAMYCIFGPLVDHVNVGPRGEKQGQPRCNLNDFGIAAGLQIAANDEPIMKSILWWMNTCAGGIGCIDRKGKIQVVADGEDMTAAVHATITMTRAKVTFEMLILWYHMIAQVS